LLNRKNKIGVLFVLDNLAVGGAQQQVLNLIRLMDRSRFDVSVCTLFVSQAETDVSLSNEVEAVGVPIFPLAMKTWRDFGTIRMFRNIVKRQRIEIVHANMVPADFWGCLLGKICGAKVAIYTRQNVYHIRKPVRWFQLFLLNRFLADAAFAVSRSTRENLIMECFALPNKVFIIPNTVDARRFHPGISGRQAKSMFGLSDEDIIIGNVSRFEKRKGYDIFIEVASKIVRRYSKVKFLAVGHGDQLEQLRNTAGRCGLYEKVIFSAPRRDMPEVMAAIDIFLFTPYWGEGLPLSVLEAMAAGKPVVASNVGSNNELVIDGETGFLPTPKKWAMEAETLEVKPLVEKICFLIENRDVGKEMGMRGRQLVRSKFSSEVMAKQTEELFLSMLNSRST